MKYLTTVLMLIQLSLFAGESKPFELFGLDIKNASREEVRKTLRDKGAYPRREQDGYYADLYDPRSLMRGAEELVVVYDDRNEFVKISFLIPVFTFVGVDKVFEVRDMLVSKYGQPEAVRGREDLNPLSYFWSLSDRGGEDFGPLSYSWGPSAGVEVRLSRGWPNVSVELEIAFKDREASLEAVMERQEREQKEREHTSR